MVQAFGREDDVRDRFRGRAEARPRTRRCAQARVEARFLPGLLFLPSLGIAAVLYCRRQGRDRRDADDRRVQRSSSRSCCSSCGRSRRSAGSSTSASARSPPPAASFAWLEGDRAAAASRRSRRRCPTGPLHVRFEDVHFAYGERLPRCCAGSTSTSHPGEIVAVCGATGSGQDDAAQPPAALLRPDRGPRARRRRRLPRRRPGRAAPLGRDRDAEARAVLGAAARQPARRRGPDAPWEEVLAACEAAGVAAFVDDLPDGYDTLDRRARRQPLRRPAPARRARPRAARGRARARARRPDVGGRHARPSASSSQTPPPGASPGARC